METIQLIKKIETLPFIEKKEVEDFVDFLLFKNRNKKVSDSKKREFGIFKGKVKISKDFDEPISDFKSYSE